MNVIYDSENYCVVEYPAQHGYELLDKQTQRATFLQGHVAEKFVQSMRDVVAEENVSYERLDEFLGNFDMLMSQPVFYH
ncbi:MAG TPA: DUF3567 family protein [Burkholderiales bacterium]|nr:DUF3567 family protein [Burkholderiales bacterium]